MVETSASWRKWCTRARSVYGGRHFTLGRIPVGANGGKQLPKGRMAELTALTGKSGSEIKYRIQFAEQVTTDEQFANALANYASWRSCTEAARKSSRP